MISPSLMEVGGNFERAENPHPFSLFIAFTAKNVSGSN